jgi:[acyl-carrier-protein] S-malonyltransferase
MKRVVVLCPGRGSYSRDSLGYLNNVNSSKVDQADQYRQNLGRKTVREMDSAKKFQSKWHLRGENASILTAGISSADFDQISNNYEIVAVCGNSMGWYTALGLSQALHYGNSLRLIETMGQYQHNNITGGQLIYPLINADWTSSESNMQLVNKIIDDVQDLYWSIYLGGQAILGGSESALEIAISKLPECTIGQTTFPLRLPMHSAFHTPLMHLTHRQAIRDLDDLPFKTPSIPLIDGRGHIWLPRACSAVQLKEYTLKDQVILPFDFSSMIRSALRNFAPEAFILLGPGSNLGGSIAQVLIQERWKGLKNKDDFISLQKQAPFILSMAREDQRALVINE